MTGRVEGKRALVIGAGSVGPGWGNGKAAAVLYVREGAKVLCVDRSAKAADETVGLITAEAGEAESFAGDMTRAGDIDGAVARITELWGGIDILHFNIGISQRGGVEETSDEDWGRVFETNLTSAMMVSRAVLPLMREQKSGALIFISSLAAIRAGPYSYVSYEASKAALCRLSQSIAIEYAPYGIRSNVVLPGLIETPHVTAFIAPDADPAEVSAARAAMVPMKRQGSAFDVAHASVFLASDEAGFVTGVTLPIDGGMSLKS